MMRHRESPGWAIAAVVLLSPFSVTRAQAQSTVSSIVGVWEPISVDSVGPKPRQGLNPPEVGPVGPGLLIFASQHYAEVSINTTGPRPELSRSNYTLEDVLASWGPFNGTAGSYRISADTIFLRPTVARNPRQMTNFRWRYRFRMLGDTLWLTNVAEQVTRRWHRIE